jgi:hypothetical protein
MIDGCDSWRKTAMHTKKASLNDSGNGKIVEYLCEIIPDIVVAIFFADLIVEAIIHADCSRLMISSEKNNFIRIFEFEQKQ